MKTKYLKATACCLGVALSLTACGNSTGNEAGDSSVIVSSQALPEGITDDTISLLTDGDLKSSDVVMSVNGEDVTADILMYCITDSLIEYSYLYDDLDMSEETYDGITLGESIVSDAVESTVYYCAIYQQAKERGIELADEEQEELKEYTDSLDAETLAYYSTTLEAQEYLYTAYLYSLSLEKVLFADDGEYAVSESDLEKYMDTNKFYTIDYLYFNMEYKEDEDGEETETGAALEKAKNVYDETKGMTGDEFRSYLVENGDNADDYESGYTFLGEEEDENLADALSELKTGDISIAETEYGVYVFCVDELDTDSVKATYASDAMADLEEEWYEDAEVKMAKAFDRFDIGTFYKKYSEFVF